MKRFLHHLFLPRPSNNHRSKLLHLEVLVLILAVLISGQIVLAGMQRQYPAVLGISSNISVTDLVKYTNIKRQENGLKPLTLNTELTDAAQHKAKHMFGQNYWAHVAPDGTTPWVFIKDSGYQYLYAGENLARGFNTAEDVVNAWMASPTHRENLLSPNYTDIGFAIDTGNLTGSETILVVQMFGSKYLPKEKSDEQVAVAVTTPQPTLVATGLSPTPVINNPLLPTSIPTAIPSPTPILVAQSHEPVVGVASIQNNPLIDTESLKRNTSFLVVMVFIVVLLLDAIIVERKKIARAFSHNLDHVMFLLFILLAGILIGRGMII